MLNEHSCIMVKKMMEKSHSNKFQGLSLNDVKEKLQENCTHCYCQFAALKLSHNEFTE